MSSIYQAASGAWVFASGSISWGWALGRPGYASPIVQKAMEQMIAIMLASAPTPAPPPLPPPSPSPFAPFDSADAFIRQQYLDLLGRPADSAGLSYWAGQVGADGSGRALVIDRFLASAEFMPRLQVARLYLAAFRRVPDPGGFDYWFDRNRAGLTLIPMARYFVGAPEFAARYGAVTDHVFVQLVYLNVFDRDPDPQGGAYWEDRLARGMDRGTLLAFFSESSEGITRYRARVDAIVTFEGLLQRPPATEEFGPWAQRLGAEPRTTLISDIIAGQEYAGRL